MRKYFLSMLLPIGLIVLSVFFMTDSAFAKASVAVDEGIIQIWNGDIGDRTPEDLAAAQLYCLGLFRGTSVTEVSKGYLSVEFSLEKPMTRQQAIIMLVRLLGKEEEALAGNWNLPFADVAAGARPYVGYAYAHGLTNGITATSFGGGKNVTANQYLTFVLRALGYSDVAGDFSRSEIMTFAKEIGILSPCLTLDKFQRGDAALISNDALHAKLKDTDMTLLEKLQSEGKAECQFTTEYNEVFSRVLQGNDKLTEQIEYCRERFGDANYIVSFPTNSEPATVARILSSAAEATGGMVDSSSDRLRWILRDIEKEDLFDGFAERLKKDYASLTEVITRSGYVSAPDGRGEWHDIGETVIRATNNQAYLEDFIAILKECGYPLEIRVQYETKDAVTRYVEHNLIEMDYDTAGYVTDDQRMEAYHQLYEMYHSVVKDGMSDYEKIYAVYNALAKAVSYHYEAYQLRYTYTPEYKYYQEYGFAYSWVGITKGKLVCEGYAEAMALLLNMADVKNVFIAGHSFSKREGHGWNKVWLDGNWYNLDATWDDNGSSAGTRHFLKSDSSFRSDGHGTYLDMSNLEVYPAPKNYQK